MKYHTYLIVSGIVFAIVTVAHLTRLVTGFEVVIAGAMIPQWVSWPGLAIAGGLSAWAFALARQR